MKNGCKRATALTLALGLLLAASSGVAVTGNRSGYVDKAGAVAVTGDWDDGSTVDGNGIARVFRKDAAEDGNMSMQGVYGFVDMDGRMVSEEQWTEAHLFEEGFACVQQDGQYGYLNTAGALVIQPQWEYAESFTFGGAVAVVFDAATGKYGLIDRQGQMVEGRQWDAIGSFIYGISVVREGDRYGYMSAAGQVLAEPQWDFAFPFNEEGFARVFAGEMQDGLPGDGLYGFVNRDGTIVSEPIWEDAQDMKQGLAAVRKDGLYGYMDAQGELVISPEWVAADMFTTDGLARVAVKAEAASQVLLWGHVDREGKRVSAAQWEDAGAFCGGFAWVMRDDLYGFIDTSGSVIYEPQWNTVFDFDGAGAALVFSGVTDAHGYPVDGVYGLAGKDGQMVSDVQWTDASYFSQELAYVQKDGKYGYVNTAGETVIEPQWDKAYQFTGNGVARVFSGTLDREGLPMEGQWGYIGKQGHLLGGEMWEWADDGGEGLLCIGQDGLYGLMDSEGNIVIQPEYQNRPFFENGYAFVRFSD